MSSPLKFQKNHLIYFSLKFDSCFFLLLFVLFKIIYKIEVFFSISSSLNSFHILELVLILLIAIFFI